MKIKKDNSKVKKLLFPTLCAVFVSMMFGMTYVSVTYLIVQKELDVRANGLDSNKYAMFWIENLTPYEIHKHTFGQNYSGEITFDDRFKATISRVELRLGEYVVYDQKNRSFHVVAFTEERLWDMIDDIGYQINKEYNVIQQ